MAEPDFNDVLRTAHAASRAKSARTLHHDQGLTSPEDVHARALRAGESAAEAERLARHHAAPTAISTRCSETTTRGRKRANACKGDPRMLPSAPASAITFLSGAGGVEVQRAQNMPPADALPAGSVKEAVARVHRAHAAFARVHREGRAMLERRQATHDQDLKAIGSALANGKTPPESGLAALDYDLADAAEQLAAAATATTAAVRALDDLPAEGFQAVRAALEGDISASVDDAKSALTAARHRIESTRDTFALRAWARSPQSPDVREARRVGDTLDLLDQATESLTRLVDGDPAPDPNLISAPVHRGMSTAWSEATTG
jgi:hypothetical protein